MTITKFKLSDIENNKRYRPEGYYEDVISRGQIEGEYLILDVQQAVELINKYSEISPIQGLAADKSTWGPILWKAFHDRADEYEMDVEAELRWINIFTSWVPCGECRKHFIDILKVAPPDLSSKLSYKEWGIGVHNIVNESLGKPKFTPENSEETVLDS